MNFSEFNESLRDPLFEKKGETPECPEGFKWNNKLGKCEPKVKAKKNRENPGQKNLPQGPGFNVWGATGLNGDGYALEDDGGINNDAGLEGLGEMYHRTPKEEKRLADTERKHKEQDDRMKYGKSGKPSEQLRPGEVKKWDKDLKRYVSNKENN